MRQELFRKMSALLIILLFVGTITLPAIPGHTNNSISSDKQVNSDSDQSFDRKINLLMKIAHMPSLSVGIVKDDKLVWYKGYGYYDGTHVPNKDTAYEIASITKTITATALMQLYDQRKFKLDDDINNYLPFSIRNPNYPDNSITFRMLLAHQSSLKDIGMEKQYINVSSDNVTPPLGPWIAEHLLPNGSDYNPNIWSSSAPGKKFYYANAGYVVIGYLVEQISNQPFDKYCKEHIFTPLDMMNTSFVLSDLNIDNVAVPYVRTRYHPRLFSGAEWLFDMGKYVSLPYGSTGAYYPAGGLRTSVSDLSHFLIAHMNGGAYNGVRILNESTIDLMHTVQYPGDSRTLDGKSGLGWQIKEVSGKTTKLGHGGDGLASHANMMYLKDKKIGVIYFTDRSLTGDFSAFFVRMFVLEKVMFKKANEVT